MKNKVIIYHANCMDGKAGAWVAHQKFGDSAEYVAASDRINLPEILISENVRKGGDVDELKNLEVYIIDFSYPKDVMLDLENKVKKLVILDHHISAKDAVESVKENVFSLDESGAMIAWKYFFPDKDMPKILEIVSDSDTWQHKIKDWEYLESYVYSHDNTMSFDDFSELNNKVEKNYNECISIGREILRIRNISIQNYVEKAEIIDFEGYKIYAVNVQKEYRAEVGHLLAKKTNTFSMMYYFEGNKWKVSLRSVTDFDVSKIAQKYGGGGHKNAAAFVVSSDFPIKF